MIFAIRPLVITLVFSSSLFLQAQATSILDEARCSTLVIGDSLALQVGPALEKQLSANDAEADSRAQVGTGLVRSDVRNWITDVPRLVASATRPHDAMVVMMGANDSQDMMVNGRSVPFDSPQFEQEYRRRATALLGALKTASQTRRRGVQGATAEAAPILWVGMPRTGQRGHDAKMRRLNAIIASVCAELGVRYLNLEELTTAPSGGYDPNYFDRVRNTTRIRTEFSEVRQSDGTVKRQRDDIHFNPTGNQLLARRIAAEVGSLPGYPCAPPSAATPAAAPAATPRAAR